MAAVVRDTTALLVTAEDVAVFYDRCGDTSLAARKQALASLTGTRPFTLCSCSLSAPFLVLSTATECSLCTIHTPAITPSSTTRAIARLISS